VPATQAPVTAVRPVVAQYDPPGHCVHVEDPVEAWYAPARQLEQLVEDDDDENVPDKQLEQTLDEAIEYDPAAQDPVTSDRPEVAQYDPAVHDEQLKEPAVA